MGNFDYIREPEDAGEDIYSIPVRAGRRTYFFDVKATRNNDYYLTITESRKKQGADGSVFYNKNKIHLYKEDFAKFAKGLSEVIGFVKQHKPDFFADGGGASVSDPGINGSLTTASLDEEFENL